MKDWKSDEVLQALLEYFADSVAYIDPEDDKEEYDELYEDLKNELEQGGSGYDRFGSMGDSITIQINGNDYHIISDYDEAESIAKQITQEMMESETESYAEFLTSYIYMTDTDRRVWAGEESSRVVEDMRGNEIAEAYKERHGDYLYEDEEELDYDYDGMQRELESDIYDEVYSSLNDPVGYLVHEQGLYTLEDLLQSNFINFDTEEDADDLVSNDGIDNVLGFSYEEVDDMIVMEG
jgi:hypothetical protein